jgi:hypothetical protein
MIAYMKKHRYNLIVIGLVLLILSNAGFTFAFWATSISGNSVITDATISIGTFVPSGFTGVSKDGDATKGWIAFEDLDANGNYVQMEDIDYGGQTITPLAQFNGVYNGNGFSISNYTISSGATNVGLFTINNGDLSRIHIENATISISNYGSNMSVGMIAGQNTSSGQIVLSSASGTLNTSLYTSGTGARTLTLNAGGLTGTNSGTISKVSTNVSMTTSVITNVTSTGFWIFTFSSQATSTNNTGGIVGSHTSATSISESFAIGNISTTTNAVAASGIGRGETATLYLGGLVGSSSNTNPTTNSFRTGTLTYAMDADTQNRFLGPVVGSNTAVSNTYYVTLPTGNTNTQGIQTSVANLQNQTYLTNTVLFSSSDWTYASNQYPKHSHKRD